MKKAWKKALSLALVLAMCLTLAVPAFAANTAKPEFEITGTTLKKYNGSSANVVIPNGVTVIADRAFIRNHTMTSVTIPNSVTSIGGIAFGYCDALTKATLGDGVTSIGKQAFYGCSSLETVTFSSGLTSISDSAFSGCSSLTSVTLPNTVTSIGSHAFANCSSMKSLTLSTNLVSMGNSAFTKCSSLTTVSIPGSLAVIDDYAFSQCTSLKNAIIYEGVTNMNQNAFRNCASMTRLTLPVSLKALGTAAFGDCKGLRDVYYGGSEEQWNTIKGRTTDADLFFHNNGLTPATVHYNSPMPTPAPSFNDVPLGQYYAGPVAWASGMGIAQGTGGAKFTPDQQCTQAQILTFLYRGARSEEGPFVAASPSDMAAAEAWAREKGMIDGSYVGSTPCTRSTAVYFIWQAFGSPNASGSAFKDVPAGADYAVSVSWAVQRGVTDGTGNGNFSPNDICNRGQIVTFLYRAYAA